MSFIKKSWYHDISRFFWAVNDPEKNSVSLSLMISSPLKKKSDIIILQPPKLPYIYLLLWQARNGDGDGKRGSNVSNIAASNEEAMQGEYIVHIIEELHGRGHAEFSLLQTRNDSDVHKGWRPHQAAMTRCTTSSGNF